MDTPPDASYRDPDPFTVQAQGHSFTFLPHGADRLSALIEMIESAQASIAMYYYLFDDDVCGTQVRDALADAARRGVAVRLIVDDFGNDAGRAFFDPLIEAGGSFALFSSRWSMRYLVRNHQKIVIADDLQGDDRRGQCLGSLFQTARGKRLVRSVGDHRRAGGCKVRGVVCAGQPLGPKRAIRTGRTVAPVARYRQPVGCRGWPLFACWSAARWTGSASI